MFYYDCVTCAPGHEHKLPSSSRENVLGLPDNWFWQVGSVAHRFY